MSKKRVFSVLIAVMMIFTVFPSIWGSEADAATYKIKTLTATAKNTSQVTLKWSKANVKAKKFSGYAVIRNGKVVKKVGKKTTSYTDKSLKAGTSYSYTVKTYKTKKVKQWYNKKTKKWQTKKPKKKFRGKSKKVTTYSYANPSPEKTVKTKTNTQADNATKKTTSDSSADNPDTSEMNESAGNTTSNSNNNDTSTSQSEPATEEPATDSKESAANTAGAYKIGEKITNYEGKVYTVKEYEDGWYDLYDNSLGGVFCIRENRIAEFDKNIDGTFGDGKYIQVGGVTFTETHDKNDSDRVDPKIKVSMYNGDESKLKIDFGNVKEIKTYNYDKNPIALQCIMKGDKRLTIISREDSATYGNRYEKSFRLLSSDTGGYGTGFTKGDAEAKVTYNGKNIMTVKVAINSAADSTGLYSIRKGALEITKEAVAENGGKKSYKEDMQAICNYIEAKPASQPIGCFKMVECTAGAYILETYSVYEYGIYGFASYGSESPKRPGSNYGTHAAFHLDSNPEAYWQTNAYKDW